MCIKMSIFGNIQFFRQKIAVPECRAINLNEKR
jgi:hypothetical protein